MPITYAHSTALLTLPHHFLLRCPCSRGSITLSGLQPDGGKHAVTVPMRHLCGASAGQPAGELEVLLTLRRRWSSHYRFGRPSCPSTLAGSGGSTGSGAAISRSSSTSAASSSLGGEGSYLGGAAAVPAARSGGSKGYEAAGGLQRGPSTTSTAVGRQSPGR